MSTKAGEVDRPSFKPQPTARPRPAAPQLQAAAFQVIEEHESYAGPIPHPDLLRRFNEIVPGAAERIIAMAESQQRHRQDLERTVVRGGSKRSWMGLFAGLIVTLAFLFVSAGLIRDGHEVAGSVLGTVDLVALVTVFVLGVTNQRQERQAKAPR